MPRKNKKDQEKNKQQLSIKEEIQYEPDKMEKRKKNGGEEFQCGKQDCRKFYHSYTAFYNHCKKSHQGVFPENSLFNGKLFQGPSKNRGRPRIKKTDAKNEVQIQSMKTENELIEFYGILPRKKKSEELIIYVANPISQLNDAIEIVENWTQIYSNFLKQTVILNEIISSNDLPDFYDPIEIQKYADKVDSYSFESIYNFLLSEKRTLNPEIKILLVPGPSLMRKTLIIWLTRILSSKLLAQVIYTIAQIQNNVQEIDEKEYMSGKTERMRFLVEKYFEYINMKENGMEKEELEGLQEEQIMLMQLKKGQDEDDQPQENDDQYQRSYQSFKSVEDILKMEKKQGI